MPVKKARRPRVVRPRTRGSDIKKWTTANRLAADVSTRASLTTTPAGHRKAAKQYWILSRAYRSLGMHDEARIFRELAEKHDAAAEGRRYVANHMALRRSG